MAPRFGFSVDFRNPKEWFQPWGRFYSEYIDFIAWSETIGYEQVWLPEHHALSDDGYPPSPFVLAAGLATRTKKMRIGTAVALAPFYHPVRLAEDTTAIDLMSDGRLEVGLGIGYLRFETDAYGFDFKTRARRSDEILQIVRRLWAGETVQWDSEFYTLKSSRILPLPIQAGGIPLFVGGFSEPAFRRAARFGDGYAGPVEYFPAYLDAVRAAGKNPAQVRLSMVDANDMWTFVSEDPEKTFEEILPHAYYYSQTYARLQNDVDWGLKQQDMTEFRKSGMVKVFTPEDAIEHFRARCSVAPMESFALRIPLGMSLEKFRPHAELFAKKVLPALG